MRQVLKSTFRSADRRVHLGRCVASGWQLANGCTDGHGSAICPACSQTVRLSCPRKLRHRAWVVEPHAA